MEDKQIRRFAKLMEELNLTGLEMEADGVRLRLERAQAVLPQTVTVPAASAAPAVSAPPVDDSVVEICSPMVGVFYAAPTESAEPFVRRGSHVKKGDVLCILEAMKLMNEITAECDGVVVDIGAGNNQAVDYGHVLFRIKKEKP